MNAKEAPAVNDSGFPLVTVETPHGPLVVHFLGCQQVDDYHDQRRVTVTGPAAHVESANASALRVHGIEYRVSARVGFSMTHDRKAERDANGDYPRRLGWHYLAGNYGTIYRAGTFSGPTDKARSAIYDAMIEAVELAVRQEPDAPTRAENHRRAFEAGRERKRAADLREQADEAITRARDIEATVGGAAQDIAALVVKS